MGAIKLALFVNLTIFLVSCGDDNPAPPEFDAYYREGALSCDLDELKNPPNASTTCDILFDKSKIQVCPFVNDRTQVVVSGVPGATEDGVRVEVHNFNNGANALIEADIDGSFGGLIPGKIGDAISVSARRYNCLPRRACFTVKECDP